MAGSDTRCPVCGKQVGVGLVSGTLVQHENKFNERCAGTGTAPAPVSTRSHAPRPAGTGATSSTRSTGSRSATGSTGSASRRGTVSVRRVEVDPERLKRLEEKQQRLREERAEAARRR